MPHSKLRTHHWNPGNATRLNGLFLVLCLTGFCIQSAIAQTDATLEFESLFGKFAPYLECLDEDLVCFQECDQNGCREVCLCKPGTTNSVPPEGFRTPTGLGWFDNGELVIADRNNNKLQICSMTGVCSWRGNEAALGLRNGRGIFDLPQGIAVGPEELIAIADKENHAVQVCDYAGSCVYIGNEDSGDNPPVSTLGGWNLPEDVAFLEDGRALGLDTGNSRIQVLQTPDWNTQFALLLETGSGIGKFNAPKGIAVGPLDQIIISDTGNHRLQLCEISESRTLVCSNTIGQQGDAPGQFESPVGVEVDDLGRIWVADKGNHRVQVCDVDANCSAFGGFADVIGNLQDTGGQDWVDLVDWAASPGMFNLPTDVAIHPGGTVAVSDSGNHRIQFFRTESNFAINAGMNDAWFNANTPGQGYFFTVLPDLGKVFMANFTFETDQQDSAAEALRIRSTPASGIESVNATFGHGQQRWVTAFGSYSGAIMVLDAELSSGGVFNRSDPQVQQQSGYGSFVVTFSDCMHGILAYEFPELGLAGEIPITRLAEDNAVLCEALQGQ